MSEMIFCRACGKEIHNSAVSCPSCGAVQIVVPECNKNKTAAALFAVFLGGFGGQKFYLGKIWQGIFCILFFWTCIPAIIGLIDFILFLTMTDAKFYEKYCKDA